VRGALLLASETLGLLAALADVAEARAGLAGETIVGRLADMLVHALTTLAGPAGVKLKVGDAAALNFRPVELLRAVLHTTLRMATMPAFLAAVAASGMLDAKVWDKVDSVVERVGGLPASHDAGGGAPTLDDVRAVRAASDRAASDDAAEDALFADPPDDFVDQILGTLMRDPVATPSGSVYERRAILECLLQKPEDPANRQPLRAEDLRPLPGLKARIEAWKEERRVAAAAKPL
jgi:ubiquitin conjugation factor E4 B